MQGSDFLYTHASSSGQEDFPGFTHVSEDGFYGPGSTLAASPEQFSIHLPDIVPNSLLPQPSSVIYSTSHEARYPENFAAVSSNSSVHAPTGFHDRLLQTDQYYAPFFNPQDSGTMPSVMAAAHQPSASLTAGYSLMPNDFQGPSSSVVNDSSPIHYPFYSPPNHFSPPEHTLTRVQSRRYNDPLMFVDETRPFDSDMNTPYQQIRSDLAGVTQNFSSIPPGSSTQAMVPRSPAAQVPTRRNSRRGRSTMRSPYLPTRMSSLPIQSASPSQTVFHTCKWLRDDNTICGEPITGTTVSDHLTAHGVEKKARDHRLPCRWEGCRLKGGNDMMNRESITRHVREKHLGCRRASK